MSLSLEDTVRWEYNCKDVHYTLEIAEILLKVLEAQSQSIKDFYYFQQARLQPALLDIMEVGVRVDLETKEKLLVELSALQEHTKKSLQWLIGEEFNPNSSTQIKNICMNLLDMQPVLSKKGTPTFGAEAMVVYLENYPLLKVFLTLLLEYRSLKVFVSTFLSAAIDEDARMRCWYAIAGTKTYRLASTKNVFGTGMNLQNVPEKGKIKLKYCLEHTIDEAEEDVTDLTDLDTDDTLSSTIELPNCKSLFIPDEGRTFFDIDYSGADAMVVAWDSDCTWLKNFFKTSTIKLYIYIAQEYLQREITTADPFYKKFKQFIHLTNYGGACEKASRSAGIPLLQAKHLQSFYFGLCPEIAEWHRRLKSEVHTKGYVENVFGARGYFLDRNDPTLMNKVYAWIPQSTIGILVNHGLVNIYENEKLKLGTLEREFKKTNDNRRYIEGIRKLDENFYASYTDEQIITRNIIQPLMQTHDSLSGQFYDTDIIAKDVIKKHMSIPLAYKDPLVIPAGIKTSNISYGDCK